MADELVFSAGEIVYAMPQLPKVTSVPLNGSAVLVGFKDAPDVNCTPKPGRLK